MVVLLVNLAEVSIGGCIVLVNGRTPGYNWITDSCLLVHKFLLFLSGKV